MQHDPASCDGLPRHFVVREIPFNQLNAGRDVLPKSRGEVVRDSYLVTPADELLDEM